MKGIKKALAVMLSVTMMLGLTPSIVMADQGETEKVVADEEILETDGTIIDSEIQEDAVVEEQEMEAPGSAMNALSLASADLQAVDFQSVITGTKPADGTTSGQPFATGTAGSKNFRIPAMVTLNDGTIVTACDARWDTTADGGGLDTIVSYSKDNGATWNYTFANYLGDNGNVHKTSSTAFIDPSLATDGSTVYMLVDLFPYGIALNGADSQPTTDTGFDNQGRLVLTNGNTKYYLSNGKIYNANTNAEVNGYTVDAYFNIKGTDGTDTNIFCSDSPYKVQRTGFLYLTKSTDGGKTWSEPTLINAKQGEKAYLVGPAGGIVTSTGRIIFPCYTFNSADGNTSVIYSDNGASWTRSASVAEQTSEASICEVGGKLYMFTRHGGYYVSTDGGATWSSQKSVGISYTTSCELNVMKYSQKIDGKDAILLSAGTNGRANGKIFVGLIQEDGTITWPYSYQINNTTFQYSALTELSNGKVAALYENGSANIRFDSYDIQTIAPNAQIGAQAGSGEGSENENPSVPEETKNVTVYVGDTYNDTIASGAYSVTQNPNAKNAILTVSTTDVPGGPALSDDITSVTSGNKYVIYNTRRGNVLTSKRTGNYLATVGQPSVDSETWTITESDEGYFVQNADGYYLTIGSGSAGITNEPTVLKFTHTDLGWTIQYQYSWETHSIHYANDSGMKDIGKKGYFYIVGSDGKYHIITRVASKWIEGSTYQIIFYYEGGSVAQTTTSSAEYYSKSHSTTNNYLNDYSGQGTQAGGYSRVDVGSYWEMKQISNTAATKTTDITITGVTVGTTTAKVGPVTYNITVKERPAYIVTDMDNTPFIVKTDNTGAGEKVTKLTLSTDTSYQVAMKSGMTGGTWSVEDPSIATVDSNGTVHGVSAGSTNALYTVNGETYAIPVDVLYTGNASARTLYSFHVAEQLDTKVWYSMNVSGDESKFRETVEGEVIYVNLDATNYTNKGNNMLFYAAPVEDGYALTTMGATNSLGNYQAINSTDPAQTDFYKLATTSSYVVYNLKNHNYTAADILADIQVAINLGADGAMGFSRAPGNTGAANCDLTFRSRKLPTVDKTIKTVNGQNYTEGMIAHAGDKVVYNIVVTQYKTDEVITYTNPNLTDNLSGAKFTDNKSQTHSVSLSNTTLTADKTYSYTVEYTIQDSDIDTDIINTVDLTYQYSSQYSSGTFDAAAKAEAKISAPTFTPNDIVIDFGLPVTIDFSGANAHGRYNLASGEAMYGTVSVANNIVTYTPNKILEDIDTVVLKNTKGGTASFKVYPATSVYYEEGFADGFAANGNKGTVTQTKQITGQTTDVYGYDAAYQSNSGASNGTQAQSTGKGSDASFTFTGTGVDIYANCSGTSGKANIQIRKDGNLVKMITVDTNTSSSIYPSITGTIQYSLPIVSVNGLAHGKYTVKVIQSGTDAIYLDGYRVYGTLATEPAFYTADKEDAPVYFQLRDYVLTAIDDVANKNSAKVYAQIQEATQTALADGKTNNVAVVLSDSNLYDGKELLDNGPKNELYLLPGQKVVFDINTSRVVQIGLKAPNGSAKVAGSVNANINTTTDMFYKVSGGNTITLQNTSNSGILSVTKVKVCDDPVAALTELTESDIESALAMMNGPAVEEPEEPEVPASKIATLVVTYTKSKKTVGTVTLTKVQAKNEKKATFTKAEIANAAPAGYTATVKKDTSVKFGSTSQLTVECKELSSSKQFVWWNKIFFF